MKIQIMFYQLRSISRVKIIIILTGKNYEKIIILKLKLK